MPAEWEPHASTWLAWPHYRGDWPGKFEPIPWVYAEIIRNLGRHERIDLIVNNRASEKQARKVLDQSQRSERKRRFPSLAHKPRLDPRLRLHFTSSTDIVLNDSAHRLPGDPTERGESKGPCVAPEARRHQMALQRLGKISELSAR